MKRFIICPVRGMTEHGRGVIEHWIETREREVGDSCYWPYRDTDQSLSGIEICRQNCNAIREAEIIDIYWNPNSSGSKFDLGIAFALNKPICILNRVERTEHKSFKQVIVDWEAQERHTEADKPVPLSFLDAMYPT